MADELRVQWSESCPEAACDCANAKGSQSPERHYLLLVTILYLFWIIQVILLTIDEISAVTWWPILCLDHYLPRAQTFANVLQMMVTIDWWENIGDERYPYVFEHFNNLHLIAKILENFAAWAPDLNAVFFAYLLAFCIRADQASLRILASTLHVLDHLRISEKIQQTKISILASMRLLSRINGLWHF